MKNENCKTPSHFYPFLIDCMAHFKRQLVLIFLLSFCWTIREVSTPYLLKVLVDGVTAASSPQSIPKDPSSIVLIVLMSMVLAWIIMEICMRAQGALILRTMPLIRNLARGKLLERVNTYPYLYFPTKMTGHIVDHIQSSAKGIESLLHISLITFVPICALFLFFRS